MDRDLTAYVRQWMEKGEQDLKRVYAMIGIDDPEGAAFHLQQAIEKFLKGFLISKGWKLVKTHDLERLLKEACGHDKEMEKHQRLCASISALYVIERYPNSHGITAGMEDIKRYLAEALLLIDRLRTSISR